MGEYAEMALDGTLCEGCGEYLGEGPGWTRRCPSCRRDYDAANPPRKAAPSKRIIPCKGCTKRFATEEARDQHFRDRHERKAAS